MRRFWRGRWGEWLLLGLVVLLAAALRFAWLGRLPPGLYRDEAYNGLDALRVLQGYRPVFFEANNGREPLFIYLAALAVRFLGRTPLALRAVSAAVGTLTIAAYYWLARQAAGRRVALMTAFLAATAVWTVNQSRVAYRVVMMGPLAAVALVLLWRGISRRSGPLMALAGACLGLTAYTYLTARFAPLALLAFAGYLLCRRRDLFWLRGWALFAATAALVALPLSLYLVAHWETAMARAAQVAIWNPAIGGERPWLALARNLWRTLGALAWRGDFIPRHNVPLRPAFGPALALAFVGGVSLAVQRARGQPIWALLLAWLATMLLPTVLAEDAPHWLRASGVLPVLYLFPALGLDAFWRLGREHGRETLAGALVVAALCLTATGELWAYWQHVHSEAAYYQFETGAVELAAELNGHLAGDGQAEPHAYVAERLWRDWPSVRFLVPASPALIVLSAEGAAPAAPPESDVLLALWPYEDGTAARALLPESALVSAREGARERGDLEFESRLLYYVLRGRPGTSPGNADVAWERGIALEGYALRPEDDALQVALYWRAHEFVGEALSVFAHVVCDGRMVGQHDGPAALGYYGTEVWRPGDLVRDEREILLSAGYAADACQLEVGLYRWPEMTRLHVLDASGRPTDATSATLR